MVNAILAKRVNHIVTKGDNPAWPKGSKSRGFSRDGALANCEEKGYSTSFFTGPVVYIVTDGQNLFYDDQVIEVPKGKKAMQIGTFRYETKLGEKVVPVIKFQ